MFRQLCVGVRRHNGIRGCGRRSIPAMEAAVNEADGGKRIRAVGFALSQSIRVEFS